MGRYKEVIAEAKKYGFNKLAKQKIILKKAFAKEF